MPLKNVRKGTVHHVCHGIVGHDTPGERLCGHERARLSHSAVRTATYRGRPAMAIDCPVCGATEAFNCELRDAHEAAALAGIDEHTRIAAERHATAAHHREQAPLQRSRGGELYAMAEASTDERERDTLHAAGDQAHGQAQAHEALAGMYTALAGESEATASAYGERHAHIRNTRALARALGVQKG